MSVSSISQSPQHSGTKKRTWQEVDGQLHTARKAPKSAGGASSKVREWLSGIASSDLKGETLGQPVGEDMAKRRSQQSSPEAPSSAQSDDRSYAAPSNASGQTSSLRSKTADANYWNVLQNNGIVIDDLGDEITSSVRKFLDSTVLKKRESALTQQDLNLVKEAVSDMSRQNENVVTSLLNTPMFPMHCNGIVDSVESLWHMAAMPSKHGHAAGLSQPKPDHFYGYKPNKPKMWAPKQSSVISHPAVLPCSMPGKTNHFPFLVVEMRSELNGGSIPQAENQAAGSGSICVNALRWLFKEAGMVELTTSQGVTETAEGSYATPGASDDLIASTLSSGATPDASYDVKDTLAFSIVMTHRIANFYVHWYSKQDDYFYMSLFDTYVSTKERDIRDCNQTVANIIDWAITARKQTIAKALDRLYPIPSAWNFMPIDYNADPSEIGSSAPKKPRLGSPASEQSEVEVQRTKSPKELARKSTLQRRL